jgi:D-lyxose ketol-isomerase
MYRSEINRIIRQSLDTLIQYQFHLPPFAQWGLTQWKENKNSCEEIFRNLLGWDITDFGRGEFDQVGLVLFTIRNGHPDDLQNQTGKMYAEKIMIARDNQKTPMHFHWNKMEDIINRNGATLVFELYAATDDDKLSEDDFSLSVDGIKKTFHAGERLELLPGESLSLPPQIYHAFWAEQGEVVIGEVSLVNDDHQDNCFYEPIGRFPDIIEDEEPQFLLVGDYDKFL